MSRASAGGADATDPTAVRANELDAGHRRLPRLGPNGEGWVGIQTAIALGLIYAALAMPSLDFVERTTLPMTLLSVFGRLLVLAGVALFIWGEATLGPSFSIWLRPTARARLVARGPYRHLRHPICTAQALIGFGLSAWLLSLPAFLLAIVYALYLDRWKLRAEEELLDDRYPGYAAYRRAVPHRMIPWPGRPARSSPEDR